MPREPEPSPADQKLIDHAAQYRLVVTVKQLEVWRKRGLLRRNISHGLGRGRGSTSEVPEGAKELVVWLARHSRRGGRPADLALLAFADGLPVPEETIRAAFWSALDRMMLKAEQSGVVGDQEDPEERTAMIAQSAPLGTVLPARIRRIDDRIRDAGVSWSPDAIARLDRGSSSPEPMTARDIAVTAVTVVRRGGGGISNQELGDVARALLPADAANPLASMIEHLGEDPSAVSVQDITGVVPSGDLRDHARELLASTPLDTLRLAWQTVDALRVWAEELCAGTETELDTGQLGDGVLTWLVTSSLPARMLLVTALRPGRGTPAEQAQDTAVLLVIRGMLQRLRQQMPDGLWYLLQNPAVLPACFRHLLDS